MNLSDLAACGALPLAFTLSLALPRADAAWLEAFARGLLALADAHDCELIGGDTTQGPLNDRHHGIRRGATGQALLRSGARRGRRPVRERHAGRCPPGAGGLSRHRRARRRRIRAGPRRDGAAAAARRARAWRCAAWPPARSTCPTACSATWATSCGAPAVGATVGADALPRSAVLAAQPLALQRECALAGGDDYELLFTRPRRSAAAVQAAAAPRGGRDPHRPHRGRARAAPASTRAGPRVAQRFAILRPLPAMIDDPAAAAQPAARRLRRARARFMLRHPAHWVALGFGSGL